MHALLKTGCADNTPTKVFYYTGVTDTPLGCTIDQWGVRVTPSDKWGVTETPL